MTFDYKVRLDESIGINNVYQEVLEVVEEILF
jgi:hypothetical protein